jgi:hypothetical protein
MAYEDIVLDSYTFTNERVAGDLAVGPYKSVFLDLYEGSHLGIIPDGAPVEIYKVEDFHSLPNPDIGSDTLGRINDEIFSFSDGLHGNLLKNSSKSKVQGPKGNRQTINTEGRRGRLSQVLSQGAAEKSVVRRVFMDLIFRKTLQDGQRISWPEAGGPGVTFQDFPRNGLFLVLLWWIFAIFTRAVFFPGFRVPPMRAFENRHFIK